MLCHFAKVRFTFASSFGGVDKYYRKNGSIEMTTNLLLQVSIHKSVLGYLIISFLALITQSYLYC